MGKLSHPSSYLNNTLRKTKQIARYIVSFEKMEIQSLYDMMKHYNIYMNIYQYYQYIILNIYGRIAKILANIY